MTRENLTERQRLNLLHIFLTTSNGKDCLLMRDWLPGRVSGARQAVCRRLRQLRKFGFVELSLSRSGHITRARMTALGVATAKQLIESQISLVAAVATRKPCRTGAAKAAENSAPMELKR